MVFSTPIFLFLFLPAVLVLNYIIPKKYIAAKNVVLLIASLFFYAWGEPKNVLLMLLSIAVNYVCGLLLGRFDSDEKKRKVVLWASVVFNLGLLFFFKYFSFVTGGLFPVIKLPIGISFFTFQIMSYTIDVYRRSVEPQKSLLKLALYISLFPQLIAGPIVRYIDVEKQLTYRECTAEKTARGMIRFSMGLAKKVIVSNTVAAICDGIFGSTNTVPAFTAWVGVICYALQIYFDFSGYSDMAIGMGHMLGFDFLENFNYPYVSCSVQEFWRRWHISLSSWFRDYLYIPLGGNRRGKVRTYINLIIVFACTGLWHGASFSFIVWGLWHGLFLVIERLGFKKALDKLPKFIGWIYTMLVVLVGWVFFRADTLSAAMKYLGEMFSFSGGVANGMAQFDNLSFIITSIALVLCTPVYQLVKGKLEKTEVGKKAAFVIGAVIATGLFILSVIFLTGSGYNPFIYFRF
ncbi:MAG: MBOAT family O-acyltransferase [Eubacteriales bacterium]|nr:MBOAT family O-acyltransferase [Eubacteriales bacterium]